MSSTTTLRGSAHYIWNITDVLGQGATGAVYKARHKNTGELYAVKTFNQMSYMRPMDVQKREFEVLQKLNHENIVKLLAIEEEGGTRSPVLIMELCTAGSLYNLLDKPENAFGLEEQEFLYVLNDVACGMKHLYDQGIVHRDIKPGNIMRYINDDGRSVYKLIDFGAARELQHEEQFVSLYGTEEYLFPDMYERAVLRRPTGKQFNATCDLWSIGVTLYHVATGQLPFRPFGGRKNQQMMHKITTDKAPGVISGVQHTDGGPIEWSRKLPEGCRLSRGLKEQIIPLLAGLCECDIDRIIPFEDFFNAAKTIVNKHVIYVFNYSNAELLHIYIEKKEQLAQLQELIAEQSQIRALTQLLLFENHHLEKIVKPSQPVSQYPTTSSQNPIHLFAESSSIDTSAFSPFEVILPQITATEVSVDADAALAKNCAASVLYIRRVILDDILKQQLITKSAKMFLLFLGQEVDHAKELVIEFSSLVEETGKRIDLVKQNVQVMSSLIDTISKSKSKKYNLPIILRTESISRQNDSFGKLNEQIKQLKRVTEELCAAVDRQRVSWLDSHGCKDSDSCIPKSDVLVGAMYNAIADFERDKKLKRLSFNEEQIHKFDKHKMKTNCLKAHSLLQEHCNPNTKKVFFTFSEWYRKMWESYKKLQVVRDEVDAVIEKQNLVADNVDQAQEERQHRLNKLLEDVGIPNQMKYQPRNRGVSDGSNNNYSYVVPHKSRTQSKESVKELLQTLKGRVTENMALQSSIRELTEENTDMIANIKDLSIKSNQSVNASNTYNEDDEEPGTMK